jgi:hypothetical protein
MDYHYHISCTLQFTAGQVERMMAAIANDVNVKQTVVKDQGTVNITPGNNLHLCNPVSQQLTASGHQDYYFKWSDGQNIIHKNSSSITVTPTATTTYTLTGHSECMESATATITINVNDGIVFNITGDDVICAGSSPSYIVTNAGNPNAAYTNGTWEIIAGQGTINVATGELTIPSNATSGTTTVKYTATVVNQQSITCYPTVSKTITIVPANATVNIAVPGNDNEICIGDEITLSALGVPGLSYSWNTGETTNTITVSPTTTTTYVLTGTSPCGTPTNNIDIIVHTLPSVTLGFPTAITTCVGQSVPVEFSPGGVLGAGLWQSSCGMILDGVSSPSTFTATYPGNCDVTYGYTDQNGCYNEATQSIIVYPDILAIIGSSEVCMTKQITLAANIPGGVWTSNNHAAAVVNPITGVVTGMSANYGNATISYTVTPPCGLILTATKTITVTPTPAVIESKNLMTLCQQPYQFLTNVTGGLWVSTNTNVATVDQITGIVTPIIAGTTNIKYYPTTYTCTYNFISIPLTVISCSQIPVCDAVSATMVKGSVSNTEFADNLINITGDIIITGTVTFRNTQVSIVPGVSIIVQDDATLNILGSHFYGCNGMWQGIKALGNNATINIIDYAGTSSFIEDADIAVLYKPENPVQTLSGDILHIANTIFNRNKISIQIENLENANTVANKLPVSIYNCIFTSRHIPFSPDIIAWNNMNVIKTTPLTASTPYAYTPLSYQHPYISDNDYLDNVLEAFLKDGSNTKPQTAIVVQFTGTKENDQYKPLVIGAEPTYYPNLGSAINTNIIDNHNIGIYAENSNIVVNNCTFQKPPYDAADGIGIKVETFIPLIDNNLYLPGTEPPPSPYANYPQIGHTEINTPAGTPNNAFFGMHTAISINKAKHVIINKCDIRSNQNINNGLTNKGNTGIYINSSYYILVDIANNNIHNVKNGIWFTYGLDRSPYDYGTEDLTPGALNVNNNIVSDALPALQNGNEYMTNAIHLSAVFFGGDGSTPVTCNNNTVTGAVNGIKLSGLKGVQVKDNEVGITADKTNTAEEQYGICLEPDWLGYGGGSAETGVTDIVENNTVEGYDYTATVPATGILLRQRAETQVQCNTVSNLTHGFRFVGYNPKTKFWDNLMTTDNMFGFTLDQQGIIGMQGNWNSNLGAVCPSNNSWQDANGWYNLTTNPSLSNYMTNSIGSDPTQSQLVVLNSIYHPKLNPNGSGYSLISGQEYSHNNNSIIYAGSNSSACERCINADTTYQRSAEDLTILEEIADGTILLLNDRPEDRLLVMQEQLFELLHANTDLLANSNSLQQFIYNNQWTSLDFIYYAGQLLAENNIEMLETLLGFWPEQEGLSEVYYQYFEWMLAKYYDPEWQPDSEVILEYANLCPLTNGTIVYAIRNLYNAITERINDFENNCEPPAARGTNKPAFIRLKQPKQLPIVQQAEKKKLLIYPNPASSMITLKYPDIKQVILYDIHGRAVKAFNYNKINMAQLNIAGLHRGIYLVKVMSSNNMVETQKLIVQ